MSRGIVIGKFYPPHLGHSRLISAAADQVDQLTIIVCDDPRQLISAKLRASWLHEMHPDVEVRVVPDIGKDDDSKAWADYTRQLLGWTPDIVATGEGYGDAYAKYLGSRHVRVDRSKPDPVVSATNIRNDPFRMWDSVAPCVKGFFARRICVLGAESTGTTTLAMALAKHYKTAWVPEFGREYSQAKMTMMGESKWETPEFVFIAQSQNRNEDRMARTSNRVLICDTNSWTTRLWHERYVGSLSSEVDEVARNHKPALYILTDVDIPFIQDGLRDGEHIRHLMHKRFLEDLGKQEVPYIVVSDPHEARLRQAVEACEKVISKRWEDYVRQKQTVPGLTKQRGALLDQV